MNKKIVYLFLALALPGLIFIFLKFFGKNEFQVPVYYENGLMADSTCAVSSTGPYQIPDSIVRKLGFGKTPFLRIVVVSPFITDGELGEFARIHKKYNPDILESALLSGDSSRSQNQIRNVFFDQENLRMMVSCWLRAKQPWSVILFDDKNQIRGYYDGGKRDEMDRLDTELSILLKRY